VAVDEFDIDEIGRGAAAQWQVVSWVEGGELINHMSAEDGTKCCDGEGKGVERAHRATPSTGNCLDRSARTAKSGKVPQKAGHGCLSGPYIYPPPPFARLTSQTR
jgi:hypothetical protein